MIGFCPMNSSLVYQPISTINTSFDFLFFADGLTQDFFFLELTFDLTRMNFRIHFRHNSLSVTPFLSPAKTVSNKIGIRYDYR